MPNPPLAATSADSPREEEESSVVRPARFNTAEALVEEMRRHNRGVEAEMRRHNLEIEDRMGQLVDRVETAIDRLDKVEDKVEKVAAEETENSKAWRETLVSGAKEVWTTFKQPLAYLVTAITAYMGYTYFKIPTTPTPVPVTISQPPVEGAADASHPKD